MGRSISPQSGRRGFRPMNPSLNSSYLSLPSAQFLKKAWLPCPLMSDGRSMSEPHQQTGTEVLTSWSLRPAAWRARPASWWSCAVSEMSPGPELLGHRHRLWSVSQRPDLNTKRKKDTHYNILPGTNNPRTPFSQ